MDVPLEEEPGPGHSRHPSCLKSAAYWTTGPVENIHRFFYSIKYEHHNFAEPINAFLLNLFATDFYFYFSRFTVGL